MVGHPARAGAGVAAGAGGLREQLGLVAGNRAFRTLLTTFVVQALATGAMLAGVDYVARQVLRDPGAGSVLFVCFVGPAIVCTPVWGAGLPRARQEGRVCRELARPRPRRGVARGGEVTARAGVYLAVAVVGIGYAGAQLFPLAMLPDVAAADAERTGRTRSGVFTGVWTAGETLGMALGPFVYGLVLAPVGMCPQRTRLRCSPTPPCGR